jgi:hypothetical protein
MNDKNDASTKPDNTQNHPSTASPISPNNPAILGTTETDPPTKGETETERLLEGTRTIEWLQFVVNALLAVIGVIALYIYGGQLKVMKGQLGEIIKQYPEIHTQAEAATTAVKQAAADSIDNATRVERQLRITQQQANAAQKSVEAIQSQTITQERPWIAVSIEPPPDFTYDDKNGAILMLKFALTNTGHSVAKFVSVWTDLPMNANWSKAQEKTCSIPKLAQNAKSDYGYLIFPGQTVYDSIPAHATAEQVREAINNSPFQGDAFHGAVGIDVIMCVDYKSTIDPLHHQTRLVRLLVYADSKTGFSAGGFLPNRRYTKLSLVPHLHGDSAD